MTTMRKVLDLLTRRERRQAFLLIPLLFAMALAEVAGIAAIAPFLRLVTDPDAARAEGVLAWLDGTLVTDSHATFVIIVGVLVLAVLLLSNAIMALGTYGLFTFGAMRRHAVARRLLIRYLQQPYTFFLSHNSADLVADVLNEVGVVIDNVVLPGLLAAAKALGALAILTLLVVIDPLLALLVFVLLGGAYGLAYLVTRQRLARMGKERVGLSRARFVAAQEALGAIKALKLLGREKDAVDRFSAPSYAHARHEAAENILVRLPRFGLEAVAFGGMIVVVLVLTVSGAGIGELLPVLGVYAFAGYRMLPALYDVFAGVSQVRYGLGALDAVHRAMADGPAPTSTVFADRSDVEPLSFHDAVTLDAIGFGYPGDARKVLHDVSVTIPAGASVAFVGPTGSGKTTLLDVLLGLLVPDRGRIAVDGRELDAELLRRWQRSIGYVPQGIFLTDDTVARNIALGVPAADIDMAAVRRAAAIAQIDGVIESELAGGYDTVVGEGGVRLSGGQRQRLGIARALYQRPAVLVLDEATNALDAGTERDVFDALRRVARGTTLITVAHRISTVRGSDAILVMEHGRIVAQGRYDDLFRTSSLFRRLASERSSSGSSEADASERPSP